MLRPESPLPWKHDIAYGSSILPADSSKCAVATEVSEADAKYIVKAANMHERLVDAIREILDNKCPECGQSWNECEADCSLAALLKEADE